MWGQIWGPCVWFLAFFQYLLSFSDPKLVPNIFLPSYLIYDTKHIETPLKDMHELQRYLNISPWDYSPLDEG